MTLSRWGQTAGHGEVVDENGNQIVQGGGMTGNNGDGSAPSTHSDPGDGIVARSCRLCFYAGARGCCRWCRTHPRTPRHAAAAGATGARWTWDGKRGAGVDNGKGAAAAIGSEEIDEGFLAGVRPELRCTKLVFLTSDPGDAFVVRWRGEGSSKGRVRTRARARVSSGGLGAPGMQQEGRGPRFLTLRVWALPGQR